MFRKTEAGFTLFELLAVLAIMALIAGIAIPRVLATIDHAKVTALEHGVSEIKHLIMRHEIGFNTQQILTYKDYNDTNKTKFLSGFLEMYLEDPGGAGDGDNSNFDGFKNPYSGKSGVINWKDGYGIFNASDSIYRKHAFLITNMVDFKYVGYPGSKDHSFMQARFQGTIIIYFNDGEDCIEIYYITKDGSKSDSVEYLQY